LRGRARVGLAFWLLAAVGCRGLPDIDEGVCGNRVVESGETCDGFPKGDTPCRPPGALAQCQLDCAVRADGTRPACPTAWGCGTDNVCRRATGGYRLLPGRIAGNAHSLVAGDFDGDGRGDVLSFEASGQLGATKFRVHYFERDGRVAATWASPMRLTSLAVADVSQDARADVVLSDSRLGVLLGQPNRSLLSETYPTYFLPNTQVRLAGALSRELVDDTAPLVVLYESAGQLTLYRPDSHSASLQPIVQFAGSVSQLAGELVLGDVFEDDQRYPCLDLAFAQRGADSLALYSVCERDAGTHLLLWRQNPEVTTVRLEPPAPIDQGPLFADIDGNGHLDLLVGSAGRLYVAFGDGQQLSAARPLSARVAGDSVETPIDMPLAAGDLSGDGCAELLYPSGLLFSRANPANDGILYGASMVRFGTHWTEARIVDLNGNGLPDLVAASKGNLDIDFFNGTGSPRLNTFVISTERPVEHLAVGDFDGDLIQDLAFTMIGAPGEAQEVEIAFGSSAGAPSVSLTAARIADIQQLGALEYSGGDEVGELFIAFAQADAAGVPGSALAWLISSGDRNIGCLVELTSFAADGSINSVLGLTLSTGAFTAPDRLDALLLGSHLGPMSWDMWLMPDLRSRSGRPTNLGWGFDPRIVPITGIESGIVDPQVVMLQAAGDIDHDGLDELVLAAPSAQGHCLIATADVSSEGLAPHEPVELAAGCSAAGQLIVRDLDADAAPDILLLTGAPDGLRSIVILWNDGGGGFSADSISSVARFDDAPAAMVAFQPSPSAQLALAYVTSTRVRVLQTTDHARELRDLPGALDFEFEHATGITASDIDGDGVVDLAIADAGSIRVLHAELQP
jgi:hypothetical protein